MNFRTELGRIPKMLHRPKPPKRGRSAQFSYYHVRNEDGSFILSNVLGEDLALFGSWKELLKKTGAWPKG